MTAEPSLKLCVFSDLLLDSILKLCSFATEFGDLLKSYLQARAPGGAWSGQGGREARQAVAR